MSEAVFLSASVPDPKRAPDFAQTADSVAITAAVSSLVHVVLGRRPLVWGGHPSITPMILVVADNLGIDYGGWVKLYQSKYFKDEYPEDNLRFKNVVYVDSIADSRAASLRKMRERMFTEQQFTAAVFIGGMEGIVDEFELFRQYQPAALALPVLSTGGAALTLSAHIASPSKDLTDELDYVALFHRHLGIPVQEERYRRPEEQPVEAQARLWRRP